MKGKIQDCERNFEVFLKMVSFLYIIYTFRTHIIKKLYCNHDLYVRVIKHANTKKIHPIEFTLGKHVMSHHRKKCIGFFVKIVRRFRYLIHF